MASQRKIYVVGHKNPDTDSICSAIAYADIKNRTSDGHYVAKRAGQLNEETQYVLSRFGVEPPGYMDDVGTQVKDMDIRKSPDAHSYFSVKSAWAMMQENTVVTLPVKDQEGHLEGLVTVGDIARIFMEMSDNRILARAHTPYQMIAETIEGRIVAGEPDACFESGKVLVGAAQPHIMREYVDEGDLVIMANQAEVQKAVIQMGADCVIVCLGIHVEAEVRYFAVEHHCTMISTHLDTYTVSSLINQSIPIRYVMKKGDLITFRTDDYTDNIKEIMVENRHRAFPVINKKGKCIGTISRRNFMGMRRKQVILVDHNEKSQAVDNVENAEILEIIDHHRLGSLETMQPVLFRNQPVGCTGTIMYQIYGENKLEISPSIAGLLCAAIISDTLMFRSPTCTMADKMAAGALALIAGINIEEFAVEMFTAGSNLKGKSPEEIFYQDYKEFMADELSFGVGQISSMNPEELAALKERLLPFMESECGRQGVSQVYFMLTNIMDQSTELLYYGGQSEKVIEAAFGAKGEGGSSILPGMVSRKKQLIPALMEAAHDIYTAQR